MPDVSGYALVGVCSVVSVITTRLTPGADFLMALRMEVVPIMAGSKSSVLGSVQL